MQLWGTDLISQLTWHWDAQLRPRLAGLSDAEYLWQPVAGAWTVRPADQPGDCDTLGEGGGVIDFAFPEPDPAPVTTIAWRLNHLIVGVFGQRNARYFDGPPMSHLTFDHPLTADRALAELDQGQARWRAGVQGLSDAELRARCREPGFESDSMAAMVLHIHREVIHHGAEIALLRDLYRWRSQD